MEHKFAVCMTNWLNNYYPREHIEQIKLEYGIEVLLDNLIKIIVILNFGAVLGILKESLVVWIGFGALRIQAGGYHCNTNIGCWMISIAVVLGGGALVHVNMIPLGVAAVVLLLSVVVAVLYAPSGTTNNPISPQYYKPMKMRSILLILIYLSITIFDTKYGIGKMLAIGTVCEIVSLLPWVNRKYKKKLPSA